MRYPTFRSILFVATLAAGCGSSASSSDGASKFAGSWTFNPGTAMCTSSALSFPVTGLAVTIAKVDATNITLSAGTGCSITFKVSGATATADAGQSCTLDSQAGPQTIMVSSWTLVISGDHITNTAAGTATICPLTVTGTLVKATPDGGSSGG
jgi:phosphotransferase system  glucose/maltose/N-acetylglucosamine-specific IIC component